MAQGAGTAIIYATAQDGSGKQGSCKVTVEEGVPVSSVTVCPTSKTMRVGESAYLTATVYPTNATNKSVIWCSSNPDVVSVDKNGLIQAKATGSAVITATTVDGGYSFSTVITVEKLKIYQTEKTFRYDKDGCLAEDLEYNDLTEDELKSMDSVGWGNFDSIYIEDLLSYWQSLAKLMTTFGLRDVALDMIDHFMSGSGADYCNSELTEKVIDHSSTQAYIEGIKSRIDTLMSTYNGDITRLEYCVSARDGNPLIQSMGDPNNLYEPVYNTQIDKVTGLSFCVHGL